MFLINEFAKRITSNRAVSMILEMLVTSIGMSGGFYKTPQFFIDYAQKYQIIQHTLVFLLIYQGQGNEDIYWSLIGTVVTFFVYQVMYYIDRTYYKKEEPVKDEE